MPPPLSQQGAGEQCKTSRTCLRNTHAPDWRASRAAIMTPARQSKRWQEMEDENTEKVWNTWAKCNLRPGTRRTENGDKSYLTFNGAVNLCVGAEDSSSLHVVNWPSSRLLIAPTAGYSTAARCQHLQVWRRIVVFPNTSWPPSAGSPGCLCPIPVAALCAAVPSFPHYVPGQRQSWKTAVLKEIRQPAGLEVLAKGGSLDQGNLAEEDEHYQ